MDVDSCSLFLPDRTFILEKQKDGMSTFFLFSPLVALAPIEPIFRDLERAGGVSALTTRGITRVSS